MRIIKVELGPEDRPDYLTVIDDDDEEKRIAMVLRDDDLVNIRKALVNGDDAIQLTLAK